MLGKLRETLDKIEGRQFGRLIIHRRIFCQLSSAWERHTGTYQAAELHWFMYDGYVAFASLAIRRMMDSDKSSVSLWNLMTELKKPEYLSLVSRESFLAMYGDMRNFTAYQLRKRAYELVTDGGDLTATRIDEHLLILKSATDPVRHLVNKAIAHSDDKIHPQTTHGEINFAIDTIAVFLEKYSWLLRGHGIQENVAKVENGYDVTEHIAKIWP